MLTCVLLSPTAYMVSSNNTSVLRNIIGHSHLSIGRNCSCSFHLVRAFERDLKGVNLSCLIVFWQAAGISKYGQRDRQHQTVFNLAGDLTSRHIAVQQMKIHYRTATDVTQSNLSKDILGVEVRAAPDQLQAT